MATVANNRIPLSPSRQARVKAGYGGKGIAKLAAMTGIKAHNIRRYERGYIPPLDNALVLARALKCDPKVYGQINPDLGQTATGKAENPGGGKPKPGTFSRNANRRF